MTITQDKLRFLQNDFVFHLKHLAPDAKGKWGVMNGHQMVEHFIEVTKIGNGKTVIPMVNQGEILEKFRKFLASDKPFRENTKNPLLGEKPPPLRHDTIQSAITELKKELDDLAAGYKDDPEKKINDPFFGELGFEENVRLLHKHAVHHLTQFGFLKKPL